MMVNDWPCGEAGCDCRKYREADPGFCRCGHPSELHDTPRDAPNVVTTRHVADEIAHAVAEARAELHPPIISAKVLGGTSLDDAQGEVVIAASSDGIRLGDLLGNRVHVLDADLLAIHLSGPGRQGTDAGLIGGGFGWEGALKGIAAAAVMNALTYRESVSTMVQVEWRGGELFAHSQSMTPDELRIAWSPTFVNIRSRRSP